MSRRFLLALGLAALAGALAGFLLLRGAGPDRGGRPDGPAGPGHRPADGHIGPRDPDQPGRTGQPGPEPALRPEPDGESSPELARFKDSTISIEERQREIAALAGKGDARSLDLLMALGREKTYLNRAAVEALGSAGAVAPEQRARVIAYLQARLADDDAMIVCAAVRSLGSLQGAAAVPALAAVIRDNRQRPDGHGEMVCTAAVNALGQTGSAQAGPALAAELGRSEDKGWSLEYGSRVLAALVRTNAPEGPAAALAYAERLSARLTGNGMARKHLEARIAEARAAAAGRGFEGM